MADKRISQLVERINIANNDVLPIVASGATTTNKVTVSTLQDWMQDNLDVGVTSVGLSMPSAFTVTNSPVTTSGNISVVGAGTVSQYIRGDGSLADFPQGGGGGGASVNYYLNGSVSQGTIGGIAYREMNKTPILGAGTDFVAIADGYLASFITDAGDPGLLEIPGGNWNFETYFSASSGGGTPTFYVELYKVDSGGTATLIASNSGTPELIAFGTTITPYFSTLAVPTTSLTITDRLALRYYVARSGRTITMHTENSHLCQIITTFTTGLTALNGLTAQVQNFATGSSGTDFAISSASTTHTFNLPTASATNRGALSSADWTTFNNKTSNLGTVTSVGLSSATSGVTIGSTPITTSGTITLAIATASGSQNGLLSSTDWTTFNGKQAALNGTGFVKISGTTISYDNSTYLTTGTAASTYLPLAGGTLTGALNGTSAAFTGAVSGSAVTITATTGIAGDFTNNSSTNETLRARNNGSGNIAAFRNLSAEVASITNSGGLTLSGALSGTSANFTGSVGIGTITPEGSGLTVASGGILVSLDPGAARKVLELYATSTGAKVSSSYVGASSYGNLELLTSGLARLTIASTGEATFTNKVTARNGTSGVAFETTNAVDADFIIETVAGGTTKIGTGGNKLGINVAGGNVYIGATTGAYPTSGYIFGLRAPNSTDQTFLSIAAPGQTLDSQGLAIGVDSTAGSFYLRDSKFMNFFTNNTERMRITSLGYLKASNDGTYLSSTLAFHELLNNTSNGYTLIVSNKASSPASTYIQDWRFTASTPNNTGARFWHCEDQTASRAYMLSNGGLANYATNNVVLSDERLKKDIEPLESYWDKFKAIEIVKYKFKDQTHDDFNIGVIAQQVESVAPEFVDIDGWDTKPKLDEEGNEIVSEEEPIKSVYASDLHHATIKVLQEAMAKIEKLETEIDSLKNQIK